MKSYLVKKLIGKLVIKRCNEYIHEKVVEYVAANTHQAQYGFHKAIGAHSLSQKIFTLLDLDESELIVPEQLAIKLRKEVKNGTR